ncbi:hypothetical protein PsorP6_003475 [Peronosclerospora sorghi]|uniref:Uncharacterized protein n=1 Tax=Peronosclerospora sorghi TaxID=230839 RepID=A0ACC0VPN4_9STRA|nr:hypothetical protein PsorP6_003475 [Peronosclerospora sorghi]
MAQLTIWFLTKIILLDSIIGCNDLDFRLANVLHVVHIGIGWKWLHITLRFDLSKYNRNTDQSVFDTLHFHFDSKMRFSVTATTAVVACSCMAAAYVGVLYTLPHAIRRLPRDHPTHILARFLLICIFCAVCPFVLAVFYDNVWVEKTHSLHNETTMSFAQWLGIRLEGLIQASVIPLFATTILFTGSILANVLRLLNMSKQFHSDRVWLAIKHSALYYSMTHNRLPSLRTYVLGPLTEEFVFRSCMIPLLVCADFTVKQIILGSPLMFGAAHLHHFLEYVRHGRSPRDAALTVVRVHAGFQLIYTSLFGAYATFIFLRTGLNANQIDCTISPYVVSSGHFASIFLVHVFCNVMGFPDLSFFNPESSLHPYRLGMLLTVGKIISSADENARSCLYVWTVVLGAYFIGIYAFSVLLMPLTEPTIYSSAMWNMTISVAENELVYGYAGTL